MSNDCVGGDAAHTILMAGAVFKIPGSHLRWRKPCWARP
jgi:hypothetical protein